MLFLAMFVYLLATLHKTTELIFHHLAYMSGECSQIFMKFLSQIYPCTRKSLLNFGSNPDAESVYGMDSYYKPYSPCWTYVFLTGRVTFE